MPITRRLLLTGLIVSLFSLSSALTSEYFSRRIIMVGDHDYPPYEFLDEYSNPTGFNVDLIEAIARHTNLDIEIRLMNWVEALIELNEGRADAISGMVYSMERSQTYDFSRPHNHIRMSIITRKNNRAIRTGKDIYNKKIAVQSDDIMHEYALRENLTEDLFLITDQKKAIEALAAGRYDAILFPKIQSLFYAENMGVKSLKALPDFIFSSEYGFATLPANRNLHIILNEGLLSVKESGEYQALYDKWIGRYERGNIPVELVFRSVLIVMIVLTFIFFLILIWSVSLKAKINVRTKDLQTELSAHKKTTAALEESRNRFLYLIDNLTEIVFEADLNGAIYYLNKNTETVLGYRPEAVAQKMNLEELILPEERASLKSFYANLRKDKKSVLRVTGIKKSGNKISLKIYAGLIEREDREPRVLGFIVDFTSQQQQELQRQVLYDISEATQTTDDLHQLFPQIHTCVGKLMAVDNFYIAIYDENEDMLTFPYFVSKNEGRPESKKPSLGMTEYVMKRGEPVLMNKEMLRSLHRNGELESLNVPAEIWLGVPLKSKDRIIGVVAVQDYDDEETYDEDDKGFLSFVSGQIAAAIERKRDSEINLRQKKYFEELFSNIPAGVVLVDNSDRVVDVNEAFLQMFEYDYDEVLTAHINDLVVPKELQMEAEQYSDTTQRGKIVQAETIRCTKSGRPRNIKLFGVPVTVNGKEEAIYGIYFDITELHLAKMSLAEEKEKLQVMLNSIGDGVIATDSSGKVVLINGIACSLTGWKETDALSSPIEEVFVIVNEITRESIESIVQRVIETEEVVHLSNHTVLKSKTGEEFIIEDSAAPIKDAQGNLLGIILVFRDSTEKRKVEIELQKNAKLESIGILAGGIAHDFNNILATIIGNLTMAKQLCPEPVDEMFNAKIRDAENAALRAKNLTQQLLTYSKGGEPVRVAASVKDIVQDTVTFTTMGSNIKKIIGLDEDLWNIEADSGQIGQVINNLTINAIQAMPDGGTLTIKAGNEDVRVERLKSIIPGKYVVVTVSDTGYGMTRDVQKNIFDPFYTTKEDGTGLGLTTSNNIIRKHNGYMTVESALGLGTTFTLYIPASEKQILHPDPSPRHHKAKGRVLLMDDDEDLLTVVAEMLENLGCFVTKARKGEEAVSIYEDNFKKKRPFDLVILDLTIVGGMGGKDTVKKILEIDSQANCIVSSGYSSDPVMAGYDKYGFRGVLSKPYPFTELANVVGNFIGSKRIIKFADFVK